MQETNHTYINFCIKIKTHIFLKVSFHLLTVVAPLYLHDFSICISLNSSIQRTRTDKTRKNREKGKRIHIYSTLIHWLSLSLFIPLKTICVRNKESCYLVWCTGTVSYQINNRKATMHICTHICALLKESSLHHIVIYHEKKGSSQQFCSFCRFLYFLSASVFQLNAMTEIEHGRRTERNFLIPVYYMRNIVRMWVCLNRILLTDKFSFYH